MIPGAGDAGVRAGGFLPVTRVSARPGDTLGALTQKNVDQNTPAHRERAGRGECEYIQRSLLSCSVFIGLAGRAERRSYRGEKHKQPAPLLRLAGQLTYSPSLLN